MARFSFQVRTGEATHLNGGEAEFTDLSHALNVGRSTITIQSKRDASIATRLSDSVLDIVDEDGDVVASLPIGAATRH